MVTGCESITQKVHRLLLCISVNLVWSYVKVVCRFCVLCDTDVPVVEGGGPLGELEVEQIDLFEHSLGVVQRLPTTLGESAQAVPLRADALTPSVHTGHLVVFQSTVGNNNSFDILLVIYKSHS